jgi:4-diphosphocytidyl-2-C-methyl-D-erythritol kinase
VLRRVFVPNKPSESGESHSSFETSFDEHTGWHSLTSFWHLGVEPSRLFTALSDSPSWKADEEPRMIGDSEDRAVSFGFPDGSRAYFELIKLGSALVRLNLSHEQIKEAAALPLIAEYWNNVVAGLATRLSSQPIAVASAPGKINLYFGVGALREDGYHQVASLYQALNLREYVVATDALDWRVSVTGSLPEQHLAGVPTDKSNLVVESAWFVAAEAGIENPAPTSFAIQKHVPVAGGMGGGSADAAAALLAINDLWCTGISPKKLRESAGALGADVPFALMGETAIGKGIGDKLELVADLPTFHWVLVPNEFGLSTPSVYAKLDELRAARGVDPTTVAKAKVPAALLDALKSGDPNAVAPLLHNDLQEAALALRPELATLLQAGIDAGALAAMVSGSGPTLALLAANAADAHAIALRMRLYASNALATSGPAAGARIEQ